MAKSLADSRVVAELRDRIGRLRPDTPRRWGTMTPAEMLAHLADAADRVLSRAGTGTAPRRAVLRWLALYSPLPWQQGAPTAPEIDAKRPGHVAEFGRDRDRALAALEQLAGAPPGAFASAHPVFGAMRHQDWQHWGFKHMDHHLRQFGL